jgi:hypothetical protein
MRTMRCCVAIVMLGVLVVTGTAAADLIGDGTPRGQSTPGVTPSPGGHPLPTPAPHAP